MLARYDTNGDGQIDYSEFLKVGLPRCLCCSSCCSSAAAPLLLLLLLLLLLPPPPPPPPHAFPLPRNLPDSYP